MSVSVAVPEEKRRGKGAGQQGCDRARWIFAGSLEFPEFTDVSLNQEAAMNPTMRLLMIVLLALGVARGFAFSGETEDQAVKIAEEWLELVDRGEYEESWKETASLFRAVVTAEQWRQAAKGSREPLGALKSRKLKGAKFMTSLPGAPDGEYVVIQFDASFENKKMAVETVTPMKDKDGAWRVSGYYIK
jgi:hypothetical protein